VQISNESLISFTDFKLKRSPRAGFIIFKISDDKKNIIVDQLGPEGATYDDFCTALALPDNCRYGVFMVNYESNGGLRNKTGFFRWCPNTCKTIEKLLYAGSSGGIKMSFEGIQFEIQGSDIDDLDFEIVF